MSGNQENVKITVTVLTLDERKRVEIQENATVSEFKEVVAKYFNAQPSQLLLIFAGKVMNDQDTLAIHNIKDGLAVHLVIRTNVLPNNSNNSTTTPSTNSISTQTEAPDLLRDLPIISPRRSALNMELRQLFDNGDILGIRDFWWQHNLRYSEYSRRMEPELTAIIDRYRERRNLNSERNQQILEMQRSLTESLEGISTANTAERLRRIQVSHSPNSNSSANAPQSFSFQLAQLSAMGFRDQNYNLLALLACLGRVNEALELLLML